MKNQPELTKEQLITRLREVDDVDLNRLTSYAACWIECEGKPVSYAPEVQTDGSGNWYGNGLRFATYDEAHHNVKNLAQRWLLVNDTRVVGSKDPVNYRWDNENGLVLLKPRETET